MNESEFDKFADEYRAIHVANIKSSGESPEFFAEYKVCDAANLIRRYRLGERPAILDFGSGVGNSIPYFREQLPECDLICLDVSQRSLDLAAERFPGQARFTHFDGSRIPFPDNHFQVVFSACVFHHIDHKEHAALFREIHRVLQPGGMVIIFEHNPLNLVTLHAVNTCPLDENAVLLPARQLVRTIADAGFATPLRQYRIFFPGPLKALRVCEPYLTWLPLGAQYYVAALKA